MSATVKALRFVMILIFLIAFLNIANAANFSGIGDGTENNPFQITTVSQLDEVRYNLSANYILMNDLDLNDFSGNWIPLGFPQHPDNSDDFESFIGLFDGNNKTIYNLTIDKIGYRVGLFCCIDSEGKISNLNMENAKISGDSDVGVIAGLIRFSGSVVNCRVTNSTVTAFDRSGGVAGFNFGGFLDSCSVFNSSVISSGDTDRLGGLPSGFSGGLVSGNNDGIIKNSIVENTTIQSKCFTGGIAGTNTGLIEKSSVVNCSIKSEASLMKGPFGYCGGIAGVNEFGGLIEKSSAMNCSVKLETSLSGTYSEFNAGGIVGQSSWSSTIADCQASGEIENNGIGGNSGGIVGNASSTTIINCFSFSSVTSSRFGDVGGITGTAEQCIIEYCSAFNSEINLIESFQSIREDSSFIQFISLKIKSNIGYIVGDSSKNQINNCRYSDKIESNKHIFKKNGSEKVNYVDDGDGYYLIVD